MTKARYPTLIIDDVFTNPKRIRMFMNRCEFGFDQDVYPGVRTDNLQFLDSEFYRFIKTKILSIFHENWNDIDSTLSLNIQFEKITPYKDPNDIRNTGMLHLDSPAEFGGVVYLDLEPDPNAGTVLYEKKGEYSKMPDGMLDEWQKVYSGRFDEVNMDKFQKDYDQFMSYFEETVTIKPRYNRLVMFDGTTFHRCPNFGNSARHTLVFFCGISPHSNTLYHPPSPLHRVL